MDTAETEGTRRNTSSHRTTLLGRRKPERSSALKERLLPSGGPRPPLELHCSRRRRLVVSAVFHGGETRPMLNSGRMEEFITEEEEPWYDQQDLEQGKTRHHPPSITAASRWSVLDKRLSVAERHDRSSFSQQQA